MKKILILILMLTQGEILLGADAFGKCRANKIIRSVDTKKSLGRNRSNRNDYRGDYGSKEDRLWVAHNPYWSLPDSFGVTMKFVAKWCDSTCAAAEADGDAHKCRLCGTHFLHNREKAYHEVHVHGEKGEEKEA